jgi:hypothetical protein
MLRIAGGAGPVFIHMLALKRTEVGFYDKISTSVDFFSTQE